MKTKALPMLPHLKLTNLIYIIAFFTMQLQAQSNSHINRNELLNNNWPPIDAEWYYEIRPQPNCFPCLVSYQNLSIVGDTIIQSKNCKILQRLNAFELCENMGTDSEFIYQTNDTLYWYNSSTENFTILYDFSAEVGDSWEIYANNCSFTVTVDLIDSLFISNKFRKVLHISDVYNYFTGKIIENIGHTKAFFPKDIFWECIGVGCDSDIIDTLRCYLQSDTLVYKWNVDPCDTSYLITGVRDIETVEISTFPNPTNDFIYLNITNDALIGFEPIYYRLLNLNGQIVKTSEVSNHKRINISNLVSGIYFFQLYDEKTNFIFSNHKILKL
ncbi:MAG: hypothetical protein CVT92_16175 [Bacteroidetes bacterium HGW-Bacteroidetes-1]|jgi:hypothetical protein|nr:MAG: hypothetical protein CVT92_16175 [Bacteroidetes bacterium HGW-Bacteroidetes-1]